MGINPVLSYTERLKRYPHEGGHLFLTPERFNRLDYTQLLATTIFNDFRYCTLYSDLKSVNTYVIDENGLEDLERFDGIYYDLVSIRLWRTQHAREQSGVDYDRMKRDEGRFNRNLTTFDYVIIDESLDNMNERGEQIVKDELHAK